MARRESLFVGVDVGGTKILALLVDGQGQILARFKQRTVSGAEVPLAEQIASVVEALLARAERSLSDTAGLGLALPGVVDSRANRLVHAPNLQVDDPQVALRLQERFSLPVALGNDVNLGTFAEAWLGAARGAESAVGIFVGTGIGGGVVLDGRLRAGAEDQAGEIGHLVLSLDGPVCGCGNRGCFEALASRLALERDLREALEQGESSCILDFASGERLTSGAWAKALAAGDELVTRLLRREAHYLAQGILSIRHLLNPEVIILGGGVMEAVGDFLLPAIQEEVRSDCLRRSRDALRLVLSQLGDDAVALGAAALIRVQLSGLTLAEFAPEGSPPGEREALPEPVYPTVESVSFGSAVIDGREYPHDLYIRASGKVRKRSKKHAREQYGTSHVLDARELERVCRAEPDLLIVGQGFQSMVRLTDDAREWLAARGISLQLLPTPQAVAAYQAAEGRRALWLHVTC